MSFDCKRHIQSYTYHHKFTTFKSNEIHRRNVDVVWSYITYYYYSLMMQLVEVSLCKCSNGYPTKRRIERVFWIFGAVGLAGITTCESTARWPGQGAINKTGTRKLLVRVFEYSGKTNGGKSVPVTTHTCIYMVEIDMNDFCWEKSIQNVSQPQHTCPIISGHCFVWWFWCELEQPIYFWLQSQSLHESFWHIWSMHLSFLRLFI